MNLTPWIGLIFCNTVWALNPTMAKVLILEIGPIHTAWIRYFGAFVSYLAGRSLYLLALKDRPRSFFIKPASTGELISILAIGMTTCFMTPLTQMFGLTTSTAANNSILVALEPIYIFVFAWGFLRENLSRTQILSLLISLAGFSLLSRLVSLEGHGPAGLSAASGDLILAVAIAGEAMYSVFGRLLSDRHPGPEIFGTALLIGATLLTAVTFSIGGFPSLGMLTLKGWLCALWIGPLGTAGTYLFWLSLLQRGMPLGSMAITLFIQPLVGALAGTLILGEKINASQAVGGILILTSVGIQNLIKAQPAVKTESGML